MSALCGLYVKALSTPSVSCFQNHPTIKYVNSHPRNNGYFLQKREKSYVLNEYLISDIYRSLDDRKFPEQSFETLQSYSCKLQMASFFRNGHNLDEQ